MTWSIAHLLLSMPFLLVRYMYFCISDAHTLFYQEHTSWTEGKKAFISVCLSLIRISSRLLTFIPFPFLSLLHILSCFRIGYYWSRQISYSIYFILFIIWYDLISFLLWWWIRMRAVIHAFFIVVLILWIKQQQVDFSFFLSFSYIMMLWY